MARLDRTVKAGRRCRPRYYGAWPGFCVPHKAKGGRVPKYPFLSDEWVSEAKKIREEYRGKSPAPAHVIKMNQVVTEVPFGGGTIDAHMDTSSGELELDTGHVEGADLKVTLDYGTAKAILVDGNPQAGMQA